MPNFPCDSLSRPTSDALFYKMAADAYRQRRDNPLAADAAIDGLLDRYITNDRPLALERTRALFKRCMKNLDDPLASSAVWHGAVRCVKKRVPDFNLASDLELLHTDLEGIWSSLVPADPAAAYGEDAPAIERYAIAPGLQFFRSLDFRSVLALGVCESCSVEEVTLLHALLHHPAFAAVLQMLDAAHDPEFVRRFAGIQLDDASESGTPRSSEAEGGLHERDELSYDDASNCDLVTSEGAEASEASETGDSEGDVDSEREGKLEEALLCLGLYEHLLAVVSAEFAAAPASPDTPTDPVALATSADTVARESIRFLAQECVDDVAGQDLDSLLDILRNPRGAAMFQNWEARLKGIVKAYGSLLTTGVQERSRKRAREDATDCAEEMR